MNEQSRSLRAVLEPKPLRLKAPFIALAGGKGGVGKTVLSANLGVELARQGLRVLLVDLDLALSNLPLQLRVTPAATLADALAGEARIEECVVRGPGGVDVLAAGSGELDLAKPDPARRRRILGELATLSRRYQVVIGDLAAGIGPDVIGFAACADLVLVATAPDPSAMTDAYGVIKALDHHARDAGTEVPTPEVICNLVSGHAEADHLHARLRGVCERFLCRSPRMAGWVPRTATLRDRLDEGRPLVLRDPRSTAGNCLRRLGARIARLTEGPTSGRFPI